MAKKRETVSPPRADNATIERRIMDIIALIVSGVTKTHDIRRILAERGEEWVSAKATYYDYLRQARVLIKEEFVKEIGVFASEIDAQYEMLFQKAVEKGDYNTARMILTDKAKLASNCSSPDYLALMDLTRHGDGGSRFKDIKKSLMKRLSEQLIPGSK